MPLTTTEQSFFEYLLEMVRVARITNTPITVTTFDPDEMGWLLYAIVTSQNAYPDLPPPILEY